MDKGKALSVPLQSYVKLSKQDCPVSEEEKAEMEKIPYAFAVGSLMYAMIATRTWHCICSGSSKSIYVKPRQETLGGSERNI